MNTLSRTPFNMVFNTSILLISLLILLSGRANAELANCHSYTYWKMTGKEGEYVNKRLYEELNKYYKRVKYKDKTSLKREDVVVYKARFISGKLMEAGHTGYVETDGTISHMLGSIAKKIILYERKPSYVPDASIAAKDANGKKMMSYIKIPIRSLKETTPVDKRYPNFYIESLIKQAEALGLSPAEVDEVRQDLELGALYPEIDPPTTITWIRRFWPKDNVAHANMVGGSNIVLYRKKDIPQSITIRSVAPIKLENDKGPLRITEGSDAKFEATATYASGKTPKDVTNDKDIVWEPKGIVKNGEISKAKKGVFDIKAVYKLRPKVSSKPMKLEVEAPVTALNIRVDSPKQSDPSKVRITNQGTVIFKAGATSAGLSGGPVDFTNRVEWASPVNKKGQAIRPTVGNYSIQATYRQDSKTIRSNTITLVVEERLATSGIRIESIAPRKVTSGDLFIRPTETAQFKVWGRYGSSTAESDITNKVSWNEPFIKPTGIARPPGAGPYPISASYQQDGNTITSNTITLRIIHPGLIIEKKANPQHISKGGLVTFTIIIRNNGNFDLTNVTVQDQIPVELNIRTISIDPDVTCNKTSQNVITCDLGVLKAGATKSIIVEAEAKQEGIFNNTASVTATDPLGTQLSPVTDTAMINVSPVKTSQMYIVPEVEGKHLDIASLEITGVGLTVGEVQNENHDEVPAAHVIRQFPLASVHLDPNDPVHLDVSLGPRARLPRTLFVDPPTRTIDVGDEIQFEAYVWFDDRSEETVTNRAQWTGAPHGLFIATDAGQFTITATFGGLSGSATVNVRLPFPQSWEPPISSADDVDAKVPLPPADAYRWYVFCEPEKGEVTYGEHLHPGIRIMAGPFPGPRTAEKWIRDNCPRARCTTDGRCAKEPALGGKWCVICDLYSGEITFSEHKPDSLQFRVMAGGFLGEPDARLWVEQNCPSQRCTSEGTCATSPALAPTGTDGWYATCFVPTGNIEIGKKPIDIQNEIIIQGPFLGEPDARWWVDQNYPSWRCDTLYGQKGGFGDAGSGYTEEMDLYGDESQAGNGGLREAGHEQREIELADSSDRSNFDEFASMDDPEITEAIRAIEEYQKNNPELPFEKDIREREQEGEKRRQEMMKDLAPVLSTILKTGGNAIKGLTESGKDSYSDLKRGKSTGSKDLSGYNDSIVGNEKGKAVYEILECVKKKGASYDWRTDQVSYHISGPGYAPPAGYDKCIRIWGPDLLENCQWKISDFNAFKQKTDAWRKQDTWWEKAPSSNGIESEGGLMGIEGGDTTVPGEDSINDYWPSSDE